MSNRFEVESMTRLGSRYYEVYVVRLGFLFLAIALFLSPVTAWSDGEGKGSEQFKLENLQDQSMCQYIYSSQLEGSSGLYDLLGNIERIYVRADSNFHSKELKEFPIFQAKNLQILSACTIEKNTDIPVYFFERKYSLNWDIDVAKNDLIIDVFANFQKRTRPDKARSYNNSYFYHDVDPGKLVVVTVSLYRQGVNDFRSLGQAYCSRAFTYTENPENLHILLTDVLHQCLDKPFYSSGVLKRL